MTRVDILQSLFERAGGAKEVGRRSSVSKKRRSHAGVSLTSSPSLPPLLSPPLLSLSLSVHVLLSVTYMYMAQQFECCLHTSGF